MTNFILKYKTILSVIIGSVLIIGGAYAPLLSSFLITEEKHHFDYTNGILICLGIIFLWGRIKVFANILTNKITK